MIVGIVAAASVVVAGLVWLVWFSSVLSVTSVRVVGADRAAGSAALAAADVPLGIPLARLDADAAAARVRALPWVGSVEVRRGWPHEVVIAVEPRVPVARLMSGEKVSADGTVFSLPAGAPAVTLGTPTQAVAPTLPTVAARGDALKAAVAVLASLPPDLAARVKSAAASTRDDVDLTLKGGDVVHWGSAEKAAEKAQVLTALMAHPASIYDVTSPELPTTWRQG